MTANEFFYYSAGFTALVFMGVILFFAFQLYLVIKAINKLIKTTDAAVGEMGVIKESLKLGIITFLSNSLAKILGKRG